MLRAHRSLWIDAAMKIDEQPARRMRRTHIVNFAELASFGDTKRQTVSDLLHDVRRCIAAGEFLRSHWLDMGLNLSRNRMPSAEAQEYTWADSEY
jgi:hypothetical protein